MKKKDYRFDVGDKVMIKGTRSASIGVQEYRGEIVTIKSRCPFTYAYELEELPNLWSDGCFVKVD